jgi:hypothetical protein
VTHSDGSSRVREFPAFNIYEGMVDEFTDLVLRDKPHRWGELESLQLARTLDRIRGASLGQ